MARGHQKIRSQQKNQAKKSSQAKKGQGSKDSASAAYIYTCSVCKGSMTGIKVYKEHFEAKHPKAETPPELVEYEAGEVEA